MNRRVQIKPVVMVGITIAIREVTGLSDKIRNAADVGKSLVGIGSGAICEGHQTQNSR